MPACGAVRFFLLVLLACQQCLHSLDDEVSMLQKWSKTHFNTDNSEDQKDYNTLSLEAKRSSLSLSNLFLSAAKSTPQSVTKQLLEQFKICGQCDTFQRFGEARDGGYLMCMDGLQNGSFNAAYSLGVEQHDKWSSDVQNMLGVEVNQFDCTVDTSKCRTCKFFKKCIVSADRQHHKAHLETDDWSLQQALAATGQAEARDGSLLMKMDIEKSEWPLFAFESSESLRKFGELIVEFHNLNNVRLHPVYLAAMQHIRDAGLKVVHLHGNNNRGMFEAGNQSIPQVVEVTFVQRSERSGGCLEDQQYNELDAPNLTPRIYEELPMAHLR